MNFSIWQILRVDHYCLVSAIIREQINVLDEYLARQRAQSDEESDEYDGTMLPHASLFSKGESITFQMLEDSHQDDLAFHQFRVRFTRFLVNFFSAHQIPSEHVQLKKDDQVSTLTMTSR